jgi:hypothetical protein
MPILPDAVRRSGAALANGQAVASISLDVREDL